MSGTLTQAQLMSEVRAALGNRQDAQITDTRVVNALNLAQQRISRFYSWPELRADWTAKGVLTGTASIDKWLQIPSAVKTIHSLVLQDQGNSRKLIEKPWRTFDYKIPLPEYIAPDWPKWYTRFDLSVLLLFPVPLSSYTYFMRTTLFPTAFTLVSPTTSGQLSDFTDKDDILIAFAAAYFLRTIGRPDNATAWESEALLRLREARAQVDDEPDMDFSDSGLPSGPFPTAGGEYWASPFIFAVEG